MQKRRLFHILILLVILAMMFATNVASSNALSVQANDQTPLPNKLNLLIMVRASKSINGSSVGESGKSKIDLLKEVLDATIKGYSFPSNVDIGIMAYGHLIDSSNFNASCAVGNVELVTPFGSPTTINLGKFDDIVGKGQSPTVIALQEAGKYFTQTDALNAILFIADGGDNCYQDSISAAQILTQNQNIQIYTIGLKASAEISGELFNIASSSDKYFNVSRSADTEGKYVTALTDQINYVFGELVSQISAPLPTNISISPTETNVSQVIDVTATEAVINIQPTETEIPLPTSTPINVESPSEAWKLSGLLIVGVIGLIVISLFMYLYWRSHIRTVTSKTSENSGEDKLSVSDEQLSDQSSIKPNKVDVLSIDLNVFLQDVFNAYSSFGNSGRYIPLESLKQKLSNTYLEEQIEQLLILARQKYPSRIWIDKNAQGITIVKIVQ